MSALWGAEEAAFATGGKAIGDWRADAVAIDTRDQGERALFVALAGENRDGHLFCAAALAAGAAAVLISDPAAVPAGAPALLVQDTLKGLEELGRHRRVQSKARVIAVTGSVGKTTTRAALATLLAGHGRVHASEKSYNNHWGVPLSLARMPADAELAVFEIGMNHAGEITPLVAQVRPHLALITKIAPAHLAHFADEAAIARAKAEIFSGVEPGGVAVVPADGAHAPLLRVLAEEAGIERILSFGRSEGATVQLLAEWPDAFGSELVVRIGERVLELRLPLPGRHQAENALGWLAAIHGLGLELDPALARLPLLAPVAGRGVMSRLVLADGRAIRLIDESYNANPASMAAGIEVLGRQAGRKVAVLGDMLELGPAGSALHAGLAASLQAAHVETLFLCGTSMGHLARALPPTVAVTHAPTSAALLPSLLAGLEDGDVVLVKGSLGSRMKSIIEGLVAASAGAEAQAG